MTQEEMSSMAHLIAKESPSTLLKALRDNGHWLYSVNTVDVEEAIENSKYNDLLPISDYDINYVNLHDSVSEVVNHEDVMNEIVYQIRDYRNSKENI